LKRAFYHIDLNRGERALNRRKGFLRALECTDSGPKRGRDLKEGDFVLIEEGNSKKNDQRSDERATSGREEEEIFSCTKCRSRTSRGEGRKERHPGSHPGLADRGNSSPRGPNRPQEETGKEGKTHKRKSPICSYELHSGGESTSVCVAGEARSKEMP